VTAALAVETRKLMAARVVRTATVLLVVGVAIMTGAQTAAADAGNEQVLAQLGDLAGEHGWARLLGIAAQITAAAGLLTFGVTLAWVVGREFAEDTIGGLFALPVSRASIVAAKLVVFLAWTVAVAFLLIVAVAIVGLVLGYGRPDGQAVAKLARLLALTALSGLLATPAAWVATLGRGMLAGIATTITTIAVAQVLVVAGSGAWLPVAAPALWAIDPAAVSAPQLALVALIPLAFGALAMQSWSRLQLDR
jgi:ABC-2 type transport system permease protein